MKNDFSTTAGNAFKYDPNAARKANTGLGNELLKELKATHYKLGQDVFANQTTQRRDYVPYKVDRGGPKKKGFPETNFKLGDLNNIKFEGQTIYMTDFVPKDLPPDENECWC